MSEEEFEELLKDIPITNNMVSSYSSINVEDIRKAINRFKYVPSYRDLLEENEQLNNILTELEEWLKDEYKKYSDNFISNIVDEEYSYFDSNLTDFDRTATIIDIVKKMDKETLDKIQELKEKYK